MTYSYQSDIKLGTLVLNVSNLEKMTTFYTKYVGFSILQQSTDRVDLGLSGSDKVILRLVNTDISSKKSYGLFHLAILVPDRSSLGNMLLHLLNSGLPLTGGADHGYSEAIYFDDPEGNGIEIYWDKAVTEWDIRDDGQIIGVTEELDAQGLLSEAKAEAVFHLPLGTILGHVHLSVTDALASSKLYQTIFNLGDKMTIPTASWIASGQYHHHLAFNQWAGSNLPKREVGWPGLQYLTIEFQDQTKFLASLKKAEIYNVTLHEKSENHFLMEDSDGIQTKVILN